MILEGTECCLKFQPCMQVPSLSRERSIFRASESHFSPIERAASTSIRKSGRRRLLPPFSLRLCSDGRPTPSNLKTPTGLRDHDLRLGQWPSWEGFLLARCIRLSCLCIAQLWRESKSLVRNLHSSRVRRGRSIHVLRSAQAAAHLTPRALDHNTP